MTQDGEHSNEVTQYSFLRVFANDGTVDVDELTFLEDMALRDQVLDDAEKNVLRTIFDRVTAEMVTPDVWLEMASFRERYEF